MAWGTPVVDVVEDFYAAAASLKAITVTAPTVGGQGILMLSWSHQSDTIDPAAITGWGTWVSAIAQKNDGYGDDRAIQTFVCKNITSADTTVTIHWSASNAHALDGYVVSVTGGDTATQPDAAGASNTQNGIGTTANQVTSTAMTTVTNGCLCFGFEGTAFAPPTTLNAGTTLAWTGMTSVDRGDPAIMAKGEYFVQPSAGSIAATFTHGSGTSSEVIANVIALRPAAAAGGNVNLLAGKLGGLFAGKL